MSNDTVYISFSAEVNQATTEGLLGLCGQLVEKKVSTVYLMLSTPGGTVMNGLNLYNVLRAMPFKLITHNVGNVDSIGNVLFLAGEQRYSSPHATFMFHGVGFDINGAARFEEKTLRERMDSIQADQARIAKILCERTGLTPDEAKQLFLEAVTKDPDYARTKGIIHDVRELKLPAGAPFLQLVFKR
ncbi:MAG TPA: ATP-dependent Clp protease proteolytic subunit [Nitrospira sp.]|nr:ATP-dependent Clp protease proteolytic subunit [Nitrospira sp.]HNA87133.1 ATP-dependent Clp protease proteolytic subunit [Nitrospira sp.]HND03640.1 ATP-dependent Clp protease proteolytic subunit [Nitrospira sp.]HNE34653.1 ATP-dependent Clp protease proteolytic subunit [Nitrospira sp.]HNG03652.1 ATP-dependent Clp protease proteolytic subunit [Nitrospira sp.]